MQVQCKVSFDYEDRRIECGAVLEDSDPEVKGNEHLFQYVGGSQVVVYVEPPRVRKSK